MYHYTNSNGFKAIGAQVDWRFRALQPPSSHPKGAYFTRLVPSTLDLCAKLLIPKSKTEFLFEFTGEQGLIPLDGGKGRGRHICYAPVDYVVAPPRQQFKGASLEYLASEGGR